MKLTKNQKIINFILTFIQYVGFTVFIIISPTIADGYLWQFIELLGVLLAIWAVMVMQKSKLNIAPQPRRNAILVSDGPYRIIRHPMYTSIIIAITPLIISHWDVYRFLLLLFLYINLILKLLFEETLLTSYFPEYSNYSKKTWKIIPYVF
jgi:protein-S-isoprenylcysteine O-methyltransferase Ste14